MKFRFRNSPPKQGEHSGYKSRTCDNGYTLSQGLLSFCIGKGLYQTSAVWLEQMFFFLLVVVRMFIASVLFWQQTVHSTTMAYTSVAQQGNTACANTENFVLNRYATWTDFTAFRVSFSPLKSPPFLSNWWHAIRHNHNKVECLFVRKK